MPVWLQYTPWRVSCSRCGVKVERVPWADGSSVFTATFEESAAYLAQVTVERVVARRLDGARFDALKRIGVAEFSYRPICRTACRRSPAKTARNVTTDIIGSLCSRIGADNLATSCSGDGCRVYMTGVPAQRVVVGADKAFDAHSRARAATVCCSGSALRPTG